MLTLKFPIEIFYIEILIYGAALLCSMLQLRRFAVLSLLTGFCRQHDLRGQRPLSYLALLQHVFRAVFSDPGPGRHCPHPDDTQPGAGRPFPGSPDRHVFGPGHFFFRRVLPALYLMSKSIYAHISHFFLFIAHGLLIAGAYLALLAVCRQRKDGGSIPDHHLGICLSVYGRFRHGLELYG